MVKVLIVDDKAENLYLLQAMLDTIGFQCISAKNGAEALGLMRNTIPDLIIADILMPVMDGFTLCRECKKDEIFKNIPFFFYTATYVDAKDEEYALSLGADRFILKPQEPEIFIKIIKEFLEEVKGKTIHPKKIIQQAEMVVLKEYNEVLIRKIEDKMLQTEKSGKELRRYAEELEKEILERKKNEASLQESQQLFQTLALVSPVGIFRTDLDGNTTYVNPKWSELSGLSSEEALGSGWLRAVHPEDRGKISDSWSDDLRSEKVSSAEYRFLKSDGSIIWVMGNAVPEIINNVVTGYIGTITDITDRKNAEYTIIHERKMLRTLIDNLPHMIYIKDLDCRKVIANKADVTNIGFKEEEHVLGKTDIELFPGITGERGYADDILVITSGKEIIDLEEDFVDARGTRRWLLTTKIPLHDKDGKITGLVGIGHDITERKLAEEELIWAKDKAEEGDRLKTAFLHNISHEIRTPMNAIVGFSALLGELDADAQARKDYIDVIMQSSDHLLAIISDIVDIANIEANLVKISKNEINVNSTLKTICAQFLLKTDEKKIKLICENGLSDSDALILTDSTKLIQIVINLISNALKFTEKGEIKILYTIKENFLEFCVSDTGIGIHPEFHQKIFDRFYQVQHAVSRLYEGTGLGLAISKANVEMMGGKIWLSSKPGEGASFFFTIPYEKEAMKKEVVPEISIPPDFVFPTEKTILVAEDIFSNFKLIAYFLSRINVKIVRAENGKEAVEKCLSDKSIDLVLMDIKMPVMDGYTAIKLIRESFPDLPIIAQTAYADDKTHALECGCSGFISKPFDKKTLLKIIKEFI